MESVLGDFKSEELIFLALTVLVSAGVSFAVFTAGFYWFRREQRRMQKKILHAIAQARSGDDELPILTGQDVKGYGELVAQFKVNQGRQVVSVLEAEGRRFIHVDGELTGPERARMIRYLKSEGFMT